MKGTCAGVVKTELDLTIIEMKIGQGSFALVRRSVHKKTGHVIALKTYEKKNLLNKIQSNALHKEIFILAKLNHPNIVRLYEVINDRN